MTESVHPEEKLCPWADSVAIYVLGNLDGEDLTALERHLAGGCSSCASELARTAESIAKLANAVTMPAGSRERFLSRLDQERVLKGTSATAQAAPAGENSAIIYRTAGVLISRSEAIPWQPIAASGIWTKLLFADLEQHCVTSLVRLDPGIYYPPHRHRGPEEIFLLTGEITVQGKLMKAGDYCRAEPGSIHGESFSKAGCTFILRASTQDEVLT
jgi:quercetin dioxygenase-like cupin family protein